MLDIKNTHNPDQKFEVKPTIQKLKAKPKLILTKQLLLEIETAHKVAKKGLEWSGALIYRIEEGGIDDLENMVIIGENLYLASIDDPTYTSYEVPEHINEINERYDIIASAFTGDPKDAKYWGLTHTHHGLPGGAYFSGTDTTELEGNASYFDKGMYISLIVSYEQPHKWKAKCAIPYTVETPESVMKHGSGINMVVSPATVKPVIGIVECELVMEFDEKKLDPFTIKRIETINLERLERESIREAAKATAVILPVTQGIGFQRGDIKSLSNIVKGIGETKSPVVTVKNEDQLLKLFQKRKSDRNGEAIYFLWNMLATLCSKSVKNDIEAINADSGKLHAILEEIDAIPEINTLTLRAKIVDQFDSFFQEFVVTRSDNEEADITLTTIDCCTILSSLEDQFSKVSDIINLLTEVRGAVNAPFASFLADMEISNAFSNNVYIESEDVILTEFG